MVKSRSRQPVNAESRIRRTSYWKNKTYFLITPLHPPNPKPQLPLLATHNRNLHRRHHPLIMHQHRTRILTPPFLALPLPPQKARNPARHPKRHNHLINQMHPQIIHRPRTRRRFRLPAPTICRESGAVPIEMRFEFCDAPEGGGAEEGEEGLEVGVVAAVWRG